MHVKKFQTCCFCCCGFFCDVAYLLFFLELCHRVFQFICLSNEGSIFKKEIPYFFLTVLPQSNMWGVEILSYLPPHGPVAPLLSLKFITLRVPEIGRSLLGKGNQRKFTSHAASTRKEVNLRSGLLNNPGPTRRVHGGRPTF